MSIKRGLGKVFLVGAGPGDPDLLTLRAVQLLQRADVILYDQLLHPAVLSHAREDAEKIDVGKRAGKHSMPQQETERLMLRKAREGKLVLRLKGGDPFVFGRGGEEAMALSKAGIAFEIVPGVTSAIAVPAYAGIPATFRRLAASCAIVTGHEDPEKGDSDLHWEYLAKGPQTLVFLMGAKNLSLIARNLMRAGKDKKTPCALISHGTYADQQTLVDDLKSIAAKAAAANVPTPAILIVGEVVRLRRQLNWFEKKPLLGQSVIVTRAREQASELVRRLEDLGARVYEAPCIRIVPPESYEALDNVLRSVATFDWVFFTSVNGAKAFVARAKACGLKFHGKRHWKIGVIGPASLEPLREIGLKADLLPKRFVSEGIVEEADRRKISFEGKKIALIRAAEVRDFLADALRGRGAALQEIVAYKTVQETQGQEALLRRVAAGHMDWITFTSSSTVKNFFALWQAAGHKNGLSSTRLASIGPITSRTLREFGQRPGVQAKQHTIEGLIQAMRRGA